MTGNLAKYHARSPRYILHPQDNTFIRVAGPQQTPWEEGTEIRNISLSGISFTAPSELCPIVGEFIRIEFEVPGSAKMACHGLVTRLEPANLSQMIVGVQFIKLEMPHRLALLQGLAHKLKEQQSRANQQHLSESRSLLLKHWPRAVVAILALATVALMFYFQIRR